MQEEGVENGIMADAQKVLLAKVKDKNIAHFFKQHDLCLKEKQ